MSSPHHDFIFCQKHLEQAFFYVIVFTHIHLMRCLSSMATLLLTSVYTDSKEYLRRIHIIFVLLESAYHYLFCLKFSFKSVTFSKSYARKQKWMFFLNTVYMEISHNVSAYDIIFHCASMQTKHF